MLERLMERGKTSGRDDDNKDSIVKRFRESQYSVHH
jgi:UMP-CMP kinase